jgi:CPA2 family monovalent cation:H+ antiporter-2
MVEFPLLKDILVIFGLAIVVLLIFHRLRLPAVVGFLITGALAGPHGFQLVSGVHEVEIMAEIGVILLLFAIGIEFSLSNLLRISKTVFAGGGIYVGLAILFISLIAFARSPHYSESVFIGFLIALSSTAIVLKIMQEQNLMESPHGQNSLAILIFQDLIIVPMILVTPILAGQAENVGYELLITLGKATALVVVLILAARFLMPAFIYRVARTQSRELFLLTIIMVALSVAWLTYSIGLSLALGAFLAGLIISESDYSEHALGNIMPFLDIFTSFFFVSIGMLLDFRVIIEQPEVILFFAIIVLILKTLIGTFAIYILGYPLRTALMAGLALSQVGEFSFILSKSGIEAGILSAENYQLFIAVSVLTMAATPFIIKYSPGISNAIMRLPLPEKMKNGLKPVPDEDKHDRKDHTVIIGFGINGKNVASAVSNMGIPFEVIEMNPKTVRQGQKNGIPIFYGDAAQKPVLEHANLKEALVLVITIPDSIAVRKILRMAQEINPHLHTIVRARFIRDVATFIELGADEVIPEEFETSVEIFTRVLNTYLIPHKEIERQVQKIRKDAYAMFRSLSLNQKEAAGLRVAAPSINIHSIRVRKESDANGKSLSELGLHKSGETKLLAISRSNHVYQSFDSGFRLRENDLLFFLGGPNVLEKLDNIFKIYDTEN